MEYNFLIPFSIIVLMILGIWEAKRETDARYKFLEDLENYLNDLIYDRQ